MDEVLNSDKEIHLINGVDVYRTTVGGLVKMALALKNKDWVSEEDRMIQLEKNATHEFEAMSIGGLMPSNWDYIYLKHTRQGK